MKKPYFNLQQRRFLNTCTDNNAATQMLESLNKFRKIKKIKKWWKRLMKKMK